MSRRVPERRTATPLKVAIVLDGRPQKDIAAALGIDPGQFSRYVNGLHCSERTKREIAKVLGRQVDELWPPSSAQVAA
jgi:hypothetical protein